MGSEHVTPRSRERVPAAPDGVQAVTREAVQQQAYVQSLIDALTKHLAYQQDVLRQNQIGCFHDLTDFLQTGKLQGLIKQPTGAGKLRLICEIIAAINAPSLVLVPRANLVGDVRDGLIGNPDEDIDGVGYLPHEVLLLKEDGEKTATASLQSLMKTLRQPEQRSVVVMTYQSLLRIAKADSVLLDEFMEIIRVVMSDEAHRTLGDETRLVMDRFDEFGNAMVIDEEMTDTRGEIAAVVTDEEEAQLIAADAAEDAEEQEIEALMQAKYPRLHLRFTATPRLSKKTVQEVYGLEVINWVRIQELVEDGTLIFPQMPDIGRATYAYEKGKRPTLTNALLSSLAATERFRMQDGRTVDDALLDTYISLKAKHGGYLPGPAFCGDTEHAARFCERALARGIRAKRCTSATDRPDIDITPEGSKWLFRHDLLDLVVTVEKIGEGHNDPTLRCGINATPSYSFARRMQHAGRIMRTLPPGSYHPEKSRENTYLLEPSWIIAPGSDADTNSQDVGVPRSDHSDGERQLFILPSFAEMLVADDEFDADFLKSLDSSLRFRTRCDLTNDDHLRTLLGSVDALVQNGKGVSLRRKIFTNSECGWSVSGICIGTARCRTRAPNSTHAEQLARQLWPAEAERLLSKEKIDLMDDDHLRTLLGSVDALIQNGKGVNLLKKSFINSERVWQVSGHQIGHARFGDKSPNSVHAEQLARELWPVEAERLLPKEKIDLTNDDHLRTLLGSVDALVQNGEGVSLQRQIFTNSECGWSVSGGQIGTTRFGTYAPSSTHAEELARQLWPEEAERLLPQEKINLMDDDHLRTLLGSVDALIQNGKGIGQFSTKSFTNPERGWQVSGHQIGAARCRTRAPNSTHAEQLARQLWPEEAKRLLPKEKIDLTNDDHLRTLLGSVDALIQDGKGVSLSTKTFTHLERGWQVSGSKIGAAHFGKWSPNSTHAEQLARQLWPEEAERLLGKQ